MGVKSRTRAEKRKEAKKDVAFASLNNVPTSPRKMRLVADLVRGKRVELALHILKTNPKHPAIRLHKLLLSAIANWQVKNEGMRVEESDLFVQEIMVDEGRILKRIQPAPQGRAHRVKKRSNHVTIILGSLIHPEAELEETTEEIAPEPAPVVAEKPARKPRAKREVKEENGEKPKKESKKNNSNKQA